LQSADASGAPSYAGGRLNSPRREQKLIATDEFPRLASSKPQADGPHKAEEHFADIPRQLKGIAMLRNISLVGAVALALLLIGCKSSHEEGVKSSYRSQWTPVAANTQVTTDAAKAVLTNEGLQDIAANATMVDGKVTGKKADGTVVKVSVAKESDNLSSVSVTVGTLGDPALGAELAKKIKAKAETP
jgi:hypothetical protein